MEASDYPPIDRGISNFAFLLGLGKALLALIISALVLITVFLSFQPYTSPAYVQAKTIAGSDLKVVFGSAKKSSTALQLTGLSPDGRAILAYPTRIKAENFTFLEYTINQRNAAQTIYLLWRTAENPAETSHAKLAWHGDRATTINLSEHEAWTGQITELALDVYGDLRGQPIEFHQLILKPYSEHVLLSSIYAQWSSYRGWTQRSINNLSGTQTNAALSPTAVVASWTGLGLLLLYVGFRVKERQVSTNRYLAYALTVFVPWIALDMLWQSEISTQLDETSALFAGKSEQEKQLADRDAVYYEYARHLKDEVLPEPGSRIFLLQDTAHLTYTRLKMQYYLFPQNTYNYDRFPRKSSVSKEDFILVLGKIKGLSYDQVSHSLRWTDSRSIEQSLEVELVDTHEQGTLYQVSGRKR